MSTIQKLVVALGSAVLTCAALGCTPSTAVTVETDGSSTVYPLTAAIAEDFGKASSTRVTGAYSGTGVGFRRLASGEITVASASRSIKDSEVKKAMENGIDFVELPVAFDGLSVVVNAKNKFVDFLTIAELKRIWEPDSKVHTWQDIRPDWPAAPLVLYMPGHNSGTFDYFTEAVNGKAKASRTDVTFSEDDNVLVRGVAGDENSMGFFGYAYFEENHEVLRAIPIDAGAGPVMPSPETVGNGTYTPLSRPLFIYVNAKHLERAEVRQFLEFYLDNAPRIAAEVKYIPLPAEVYVLVRERLNARTLGSAFQHAKPGADLAEILRSSRRPH